LLEQDSADQTIDAVLVEEDADDINAPSPLFAISSAGATLSSDIWNNSSSW